MKFLRELLALNEAVLNEKPLPFNWLDDRRCTFEHKGLKYGIIVTYHHLIAPPTNPTAAVIGFGVQTGPSFKDVADLDGGLTGKGWVKTILSTVADACLANKKVTSRVMIAAIAADHRKIRLYKKSLDEIKVKLPEFRAFSFDGPMENGNTLIVISRVAFSNPEKIKLAANVQLKKES